jgi:ABC-type polar amino acid transport system ATPase subunit
VKFFLTATYNRSPHKFAGLRAKVGLVFQNFNLFDNMSAKKIALSERASAEA